MGTEEFTVAFNGSYPGLSVPDSLLLESACCKDVTSPAEMALTNSFAYWGCGSDKRQSKALYNSLVIHSLLIYLFKDHLSCSDNR